MLRTFAFAALTLAATAFFTAPARAVSVFYGIVVHTSTQNIKVQDPRTKQTLSFTLVPHFKDVFSADGKTTYQMAAVKPGRYVGVIYDQKGLGIRHADEIYLMTDANQRIAKQKG